MAVLIKSNGVEEVVEPQNGTDFTLEELQGYVGGTVQLTRIDSRKSFICNEDGKLIGMPVNAKASLVTGITERCGDILVGDVLIINNNQVK